MTARFHVEIKQHQDWHFATCRELDGLFVGHKNHDTVLCNIPECIAMIIKHDRKEDVEVREVKPSEPTLLGERVYEVTNKLKAA